MALIVYTLDIWRITLSNMNVGDKHRVNGLFFIEVSDSVGFELYSEHRNVFVTEGIPEPISTSI